MRLSEDKIKAGFSTLTVMCGMRRSCIFPGPLAATRPSCRSPSKQLNSTAGRGLFLFRLPLRDCRCPKRPYLGC